jgi:hypothetical protein
MYFYQGLKNLNIQKKWSFLKKSFKDWNILFTYVWKYCCENG